MQNIICPTYSVCFGNATDIFSEFIKHNSYSKVFFIIDSNTSEYCYPNIALNIGGDIPHDIIEVDAGEESKDIDICIGVWKMLMDFGADRRCLVVNLGGGMVLDLGGFAASTYKRGVDFIHIPTTLLAMTDAAIGGKNGINIDSIKNMIGTITNPKLVIVDKSFLETLPERELSSGFAEMLKHGLILDKNYFEVLSQIKPTQLTDELIYQSVKIKAEVVEKDPKEKNFRKILNFGHTIGHALETFSLLHDEKPLLHGEAVAVGMLVEAYLSVYVLGLSKSEFENIAEVISKNYAPYVISEEQYEELLGYMESDKKNEGKGINFTLLNAIGSASVNHICSREQIVEALRFYSRL